MVKHRNPTTVIKIAIFALTFLLYANSIKNEFALDDEMVTVTNRFSSGSPAETDNPNVAKGIRGIGDIFTSFQIEVGDQRFIYRPITSSTYALEYEFFRGNPHISHFINILLYALTNLVLFLILARLLVRYHIILPLLILFLFLAHPIHSEVVNNLKSRDELLSFLGGLSAMFCYLKYADEGRLKHLLLGALLMAIGTLSKITVSVFLVIIPLALYYFTQTANRKIALITISIFLAIGACLLTNALLVEGSFSRNFQFFENPLYTDDNLLNRIPVAFYSLAYYLKLLVFPYALCCFYGFNQIPIAGWTNGVVLVSMLFFTALGIYCITQFTKKSMPVFGIVLFLISISPFLNFVTPSPGIIAERFAYVASLGFCLVLAYGLLRLFRVPVENKNYKLNMKPGLVITLVLIFGFYSVKTISRNTAWKDHLTLYSNDISHCDRSAKLHAILGTEIINEAKKMNASGGNRDFMNRVKEGMSHYRKALEIYPEYDAIHINLGTAYANFLGDEQNAIKHYQQAIDIKEKQGRSIDDAAYYNLGSFYRKAGKTDSAIVFMHKLLESNPESLPAYHSLFDIYFDQKDIDEALVVSNSGIARLPEEPGLYINKGEALMIKKDTLQALQCFEQAFSLSTQNKNLATYLGQLYLAVGDREKAQFYLQKLNELK